MYEGELLQGRSTAVLAIYNMGYSKSRLVLSRCRGLTLKGLCLQKPGSNLTYARCSSVLAPALPLVSKDAQSTWDTVLCLLRQEEHLSSQVQEPLQARCNQAGKGEDARQHQIILVNVQVCVQHSVEEKLFNENRSVAAALRADRNTSFQFRKFAFESAGMFPLQEARPRDRRHQSWSNRSHIRP